MSRKNTNIVRDDISGSAASILIEQLLPVIARKKAANSFPTRAGASLFHEVKKGWETDVLRKDESVCIAHNTLELEKAYDEPKIKTILISCNGSVTKTVALRICCRHGQSKTIFYEGE